MGRTWEEKTCAGCGYFLSAFSEFCGVCGCRETIAEKAAREIREK